MAEPTAAVTDPVAGSVDAGRGSRRTSGRVARRRDRRKAEIVRTAIQVIGPKPGTPLVSSFFLMLFCAEQHAKKGAHIFADSGLVIDPDAEEMAIIARSAAESFRTLTAEVPRVAMLSFSTRGSAATGSCLKANSPKIRNVAISRVVMTGRRMQSSGRFISRRSPAGR